MNKSSKAIFEYVLLVAALVFLGYSIYYALDERVLGDEKEESSVTNTTQQVVEEAEEDIEDTDDIDEQLDELDELDLDAEFDTSELEAELEALQQ